MKYFVKARISELKGSVETNRNTVLLTTKFLQTCPTCTISNNVALVCKICYIQRLINELGMNNQLWNPTYTKTKLWKSEVRDNHIPVPGTFSIIMADKDLDLHSLQSIRKLYKHPCKQILLQLCLHAALPCRCLQNWQTISLWSWKACQNTVRSHTPAVMGIKCAFRRIIKTSYGTSLARFPKSTVLKIRLLYIVYRHFWWSIEVDDCLEWQTHSAQLSRKQHFSTGKFLIKSLAC